MRSILLLLPFTFATACTATAIDANNPLTLLVGPDGGSVESDGLKIDVPAGAVDSEVTLTAYPKTRVIDGVTTASSTWSFGPDGQAFNKAIAVSFAYEGQHDAATVWWTKEGDLTTFTNLKTTKADGWATANVVHFSEGAVGDDTCGSGTDATDAEDADNEEEDGGDEGDGDCVDGIDSVTGEECDGGPSANQDDGEDTGDEADAEESDSGDDADSEEEDGSDESDGVDCEDGIDAATGEECDGGPSANQDDGEEHDGEEADSQEEHGACERDESEANDDEDDGEAGDEGDDTDNVEE